MDKMNICVISREFPPDTAFGGIATFSLDTALILKSRGHDVTVFSQSLVKSHMKEWKGLQVHKIKVPRPFSSYRMLPVFILGYNFVIMREVIRCHRRRPFDVIDVPDHLAEGLFTTLLPHIPVVTRLHTPYALFVAMGLNNYRKGFSYWFIKTVEKIALHRSQVLYAPTEDLVRRCDQMFSIGNIPSRIFGYPLDLNVFSPSVDHGIDGAPRILFVSRLEQRKGIETIAAAFPLIRAQNNGATLTLVGNDTPNIQGFASAHQYLESAFTKAGCINAVQFVNYVPLEKLPEIFHAHDIVWVPSMYDNYPLVCLEAMACGKAVVVSDVGGLPEMVQHNETGLLFEKGNAEALAEQTLRLFESPELRQYLGKNARVYCEAHCSENVIYEKNIDLYEVALAEQRKIRK